MRLSPAGIRAVRYKVARRGKIIRRRGDLCSVRWDGNKVTGRWTIEYLEPDTP